ncbi:MAG: beta-ketoacyl synthase N-terminal-like domain-containing protein [Desulfobacterales bacterium]
MGSRQVVITGIGLISPLGQTARENWENLKSHHSGIKQQPEGEQASFLQYKGTVAAPPIPEDISPKLMGQLKFLNRGALLGFHAAHEATTETKTEIEAIPPQRRALYVASGDFTKVGYDYMHPAVKESAAANRQGVDFPKLNRSTLDKVYPFFLLESLHNNLFSFLSAYLEFMGPNTSLASLSPCGGNALELAYRSIKQNTADIALAVGYGNWITEIPLFELDGLGILSKCRAGVSSFRPFDKRRDGFIGGEGGVALILEVAENVSPGGASVWGELQGFGNCIEFDSPYKLSVPLNVSQRSMSAALTQAGCSIDDLAFIIPHGSGTRKGDRSEMKSMANILAGHIGDVPICGLKPYTGHLGATSDLAEIIFGLLGAREGIAPATPNFEATENEFADLRISNAHQSCTQKHFLSISYGLGGQSTAVVVEAK